MRWGLLVTVALVVGELPSAAVCADGPAGRSWARPSFLSVDQAFRFSYQIDKGKLRLHWQVAPGYRLYRSKFEVTFDKGSYDLGNWSLSGVSLYVPENAPVMQYVLVGPVDAEVPVYRAQGKDRQGIYVHYQGCAEAGYCYPPQTIRVEL